ncbi:MAG: hypothetical protein RRA94_05100 [Bacteroidota bacterium]|nr:hypothetical protein [Bacteroidota bacterium]
MRFLFVFWLLLTAPLSAQKWEDVGGPYGGTYVDIITHNDSLVAAPYYRSFLLFGNALGSQWRRVDMPSPAAEAFSLLSPGGGRLLAGSFGRVYRSDDEGATWSESAIPDLLGEIVNAMTGSGDTIFACGGEKVLRSTDRGVRWTVLDDAPAANSVLYHAGTLWAGGAEGLYRSEDYGGSWEAALSKQDTVYAIWQVDHMLFATITGNSVQWNSPLLRSINGGAQWKESPLWAPVSTIVSYRGDLYAGVKDAARLATMYRSSDGGESWQPWQHAGVPFPRDVWQLHAAPNGRNGLLASLGGIGIWRYDDVNRDWRFTTHGHFPVGVAKVAFHEGVLFAYSMKERFIAVKNPGSPGWQIVLYPGNGRPGDMFLRGDTLLLGGDGALLLSTDLGTRWQVYDIPGLDATVQAMHVSADHRQWLLAPAEHELLLSQSNGQSWGRLIDTGTPKQWFALAEGPNSHTSIFTLSTDGASVYDAQWNRQDIPALGTAYDMAQNGGAMLFAGESGLLRWDAADGVIDTLNRQSTYSIAQSAGTAFAVATRDSGVVLHRSVDDEPGQRLCDGLPATGYAPPTVCRIALAWEDSTLYFGNCGLPGLWRIALPSITMSAQPPSPFPAGITLGTPYPNPARVTTQLHVDIPSRMPVRVTLVDHLGRVRRVVQDGAVPAGVRLLSTELSGLPAGQYYWVCTFPGGMLSRPLTVLY